MDGQAHIGTTNKRAIPRKNLGMDQAVPHRLGNNTAINCLRNYPYRINDLPPGKDAIMRKPIDYDAELKTLEDKAGELKAARQVAR